VPDRGCAVNRSNGVPARRRAVAVLAVAAAAAGVSQSFGRFTYSLLFTDVRDDLALSNTLAGSLGSTNLFAYLAGTLVVSLGVGRLGLSRTTRIGVVGVTVGLGVMAWASSAPPAFVALACTGFFAAGVWVTVPALAAAQVAPERRGAAIGVVGAGIGSGIVIASVLHSTVAADDWHAVYRIEAALAAVIAAAALAWLRDPAAPSPGRGGLDALRAVPAWKRLLTSYGLYGLGMSLMVTFLVAVLREDAGYSVGAASLAFSCFGVGTVFGGPVFGPLSDRIGRGEALAVAYAVMATMALAIASGARPWATVAAFCFGVAFTGEPTIVAARISDAVTAERFGMVYGLATLAFGAGLMAGPQLGGLIGDRTGSFRPVFVFAAAIAVVAAGFGWHRPAVSIDGSGRRRVDASSTMGR